MAVVSLGTNIASLNAQRRLGESSAQLGESFVRLSSGLRINRAKDDAAGLAIASSLALESRVYTVGVRNLNDAISAMNIAEGAQQQLSNITIRLSELSEQAANGVFSNDQRQALDEEADALVDEYNRIVRVTEFNGRTLLDGGFQGVLIQAGFGANEQIATTFGSEPAQVDALGTFQAAVSYATRAGAGEHIAGDYNRDGAVDIAFAVNNGGGPDAFHILFGNGDGTFKAQVSYTTVSTVAQIHVADFNGDGIADIAVNGGGNAQTNIHLGNQDGSFSFGGFAISTSGGLADVKSGDLNGDGKADLVVADYSSHTVEIFLGNGNGTFTARTTNTLPGGLREVQVADFNGDGTSDLATEYGVMFGNGNGTFKSSAVNSNIGSTYLELGDVNGDGYLDQVGITTNVGGGIVVRFGGASGTFGAFVSQGTLTASQSHVVTDVNDDDILDVVVVQPGSNQVSIHLGNGNGSFKAPTSVSALGTPGGVIVADINGDGVGDLSVMDGTTGIMTANIGDGHGVYTIDRLDLTTQSSALAALETVRDLRERIGRELGRIGSDQSRFLVAINALEIRRVNTTSAASAIMDADISTEAAELARRRILQQGSAAVLAQANDQTRIALQLLGV